MTKTSFTRQDAVKLGLFPFLVFMINYCLMLILPDAGRAYQADTLLHLFGGMSIAYSANHALLLAERSKLITFKSRLLKIVMIVGMVMIAAVLWEVYEFVWDQIFGTLFQPSKADTIKDLIMGMLGGIVFCGLFLKQRKKLRGAMWYYGKKR